MSTLKKILTNSKLSYTFQNEILSRKISSKNASNVAGLRKFKISTSRTYSDLANPSSINNNSPTASPVKIDKSPESFTAANQDHRHSSQAEPELKDKEQPEPENISTTHFGFKSVPEVEKETLVGKVFSKVASSYDLMNDCMSMGVHRLWKDHFIQTLAPGPGTKLLDVAGGTGDIALRFLSYCQKVHQDNTAQVQVVDINPNMLAHGAKRYQQTEFVRNGQATFQVGNAECLEGIADNSVDAYTISFGIRNCTHVDLVLKEAYRVLKPGGRFMCLEFSKVEAPVIKQMYDLYSFQIIPQLGSIVSNDRDSYQYLVESIRQFPDQETFSRMIQTAGFATVGCGYENLTFGVAAIHTGYKF